MQCVRDASLQPWKFTSLEKLQHSMQREGVPVLMQTMQAYLSRTSDRHILYWACGADGALQH